MGSQLTLKISAWTNSIKEGIANYNSLNLNLPLSKLKRNSISQGNVKNLSLNEGKV